MMLLQAFDKSSGHWPAPQAEVMAKAAMAGVVTVSCLYLSISVAVSLLRLLPHAITRSLSGSPSLISSCHFEGRCCPGCEESFIIRQELGSLASAAGGSDG
jgi:hypothetical protein